MSSPTIETPTITAEEVAGGYRPGDILLRAGEDEWIKQLTEGPYSHAGICVTGPPSEEGVDALDGPTRNQNYGVARFSIAEFYNDANAPGGGDVFRYTGSEARASVAAKWAEEQTGEPYTFDLLDPIIGAGGSVEDNNRLYCSEFVWRCYRQGAGVTLVDPRAFVNLKDPSVYERNVEILAKAAQLPPDPQIPSKWPSATARKLVKQRLGNHNGFVLAPSQLATSRFVRRIKSIGGGARMQGSRIAAFEGRPDGGKK